MSEIAKCIISAIQEEQIQSKYILESLEEEYSNLKNLPRKLKKREKKRIIKDMYHANLVKDIFT